MHMGPDGVVEAELSDQFAGLPPFLRVLLVTDGTVTRSLEAYFLERIEVVVLAHAETPSDRGHPEIDAARGDSILDRQVVLRGQVSGCAYAFAESIFAIDRVPPAVRRQLIEERKGIGEVLRAGRLETYRELYAIRRAEAGEWARNLGIDASAEVAIRDYRIFLEGRPAIRIEEVFPVARYQGASAQVP